MPAPTLINVGLFVVRLRLILIFHLTREPENPCPRGQVVYFVVEENFFFSLSLLFFPLLPFRPGSPSLVFLGLYDVLDITGRLESVELSLPTLRSRAPRGWRQCQGHGDPQWSVRRSVVAFESA